MPATAHHVSWFARLLGLRAVKQPVFDPADMGTAIAMDYLLDQQPTGAPGGSSTAGKRPASGWHFGALVQTSTTHHDR